MYGSGAKRAVMRALLLWCIMMATVMASPSEGRFHALRLRPGQDLKPALTAYVKKHNLKAAAVVTCVGSLRRAQLRLADRSQGTTLEGPFEIVSLVGCGGVHGWHLHLTLADGQGKTVGGHLLEGNSIYTTAEIVLVELEELEFLRLPDRETGYNELVVATPIEADVPREFELPKELQAPGESVTLQALVYADGRASLAVLESSGSAEVDRYVLDEVRRQAQFRPATDPDGEGVPSGVEFTILLR